MMQWDLQLFAEKTERATPRRRQEAREQGRVASSPELTTAVSFLALILGLRIFGGALLQTLTQMFAVILSTGTQSAAGGTGFETAWLSFLPSIAMTLVPIVLLGIGAGVLMAFLQVGPMFAPDSLIPDFSRINPFKGIARLFSTQSLVDLVKSMFKLALIGWAVYSALSGAKLQFPEMMTTDPAILASYFLQTGQSILLNVAIMFAILSLADFAYRRFSFERSLRMSKEDIKDEMKRQEGSPQIKRRLRERGRAIARRRMMQKVPTATVVVTNPTHFAVALYYDAASMNAPQVVAKGADETARKIREIASDHRVPIVENVAVARALYYTVELDEFVPNHLFQAVAEVLAYVYRLQQRTP